MRITINDIRNNASQATRFFTGFDWGEIEVITNAVVKTYSENDTFDADYGGLPYAIAKRLTSEQVDYLVENQPRSTKQVARELARGMR